METDITVSLRSVKCKRKVGSMWSPFPASFVVLAAITASASRAATTVVTFDQPATAGMSGFRAMWDTPIPLAADGPVEQITRGNFGTGPGRIGCRRNAVKSPAPSCSTRCTAACSVRFPGIASEISKHLAAGRAVAKVELVLTHQATELWPEGYLDPAGMSFLGTLWADNPPRWHAVAYALRKPWLADAKIGPTYNAYVNGAAYWTKFRARIHSTTASRSNSDPRKSHRSSPKAGSTSRRSLRATTSARRSANGCASSTSRELIVRKWEVYDFAYWRGTYEWGTATAARDHRQATTHRHHFHRRSDPAGSQPHTADRRGALKGGQPTAVMPSAEQIKQFATDLGFRKPESMPGWQWQRVSELNAIGGDWSYPATPEDYAKWIDHMLAIQPRRWEGFEAPKVVQDYVLYSSSWPEPVRDHWKLYWWAWLLPDRDHTQLVHSHGDVKLGYDYYARTKDWRGNLSVYRAYCRNMGTMNFNHWAAAGTLMGGAIIGSQNCIDDGRYGLSTFPLRTWSWFDGSTQETIDHYYFAHSLAGQKAFADVGPEPIDRIMGQTMLDKSVEELASSYHPNLRRMISGSSRTGMAYILGVQDALQYILHTLSPRGALTDTDRPKLLPDMPTFGHGVPAGQVALQTLNNWSARPGSRTSSTTSRSRTRSRRRRRCTATTPARRSTTARTSANTMASAAWTSRKGARPSR